MLSLISDQSLERQKIEWPRLSLSIKCRKMSSYIIMIN